VGLVYSLKALSFMEGLFCFYLLSNLLILVTFSRHIGTGLVLNTKKVTKEKSRIIKAFLYKLMLPR